MHTLPGIVDGARKTSQVGTEVKGGSGRFSSLHMPEATNSRDQRMSVVTSAQACNGPGFLTTDADTSKTKIQINCHNPRHV